MLWFLVGSPRRAGFRGVPWMPSVRIPRFKSHLLLATLGDGRSISITARADENFNVVVMASSLNKPTTQVRLVANGNELAVNEGFSINYLWSKNNMQASNTLEVEATDDNGAIHKTIAIIPKP